MIRIAHIVELPGSNAWLNGIAEHYDRARFEHLVVSLGARNGLHPALEARGVRSFALESPSRRDLPRAILGLARLLRREKIDVLQTHLFDPTTVGLAAAALARTPLRIVTRHHANFSTMFHKPVHRQIDRLHALFGHRVWTPSRFVKDCMVELEHVPPAHITILPYSFDFAALRPRLDGDARRRLRDQLGGDAQLLVGMVGRLSVEKEHEVLLRAMPELLARQPRVRLVLAGAGPRRAELESLARTLGIAAQVSFLGWRNDAWDLFEAMDVVAHPCSHEAFGIVYVEAMALERPVVTCRGAAAPEIIDDGETGLLVPPRDPPAMARAILTLLEAPARARALGQEARRRVVERYSCSRMMPAYEQAYDEWVSQLPRRRKIGRSFSRR
jgi:glycosyltransferase involved in cell wall biosynthesis